MVKPTPADLEAQTAEFQVQLAHSFHDARDWVSATLPGPVGGAVNDALYLVRRLVLPTGEHVGIHGTAECVAAKDCSGKDLTGAQHHDEDVSGVDFTGADLTHANFRNADFSKPATAAGPLPAASTSEILLAVGGYTSMVNANLSGADMRGTNLSFRDMNNANLTGANLTGANLMSANLQRANLTDANLTGANLSQGSPITAANLSYANLTNANLTDANLSGALMAYANLSGANLNGTRLNGARLTVPFTRDLLNGNLPVLVDFWADWSGPAKLNGPIFEKVAADYAGRVVFAKIDVDADPTGSAQDFGITSIPTYAIFIGGRMVGYITGTQPEPKLKAFIAKYV